MQSILDHYRTHAICASILRRRHARSSSPWATAVASTTDDDYGLWGSLHGRQQASASAGLNDRSEARRDAAQAAEPSLAARLLEHTAEMRPAEDSEGQDAGAVLRREDPEGEIFADPAAEPSGSGRQQQGSDGEGKSRLSRRGLPKEEESSSFQQRLRLTIQGSAQQRDGVSGVSGAIHGISAGVLHGKEQDHTIKNMYSMLKRRAWHLCNDMLNSVHDQIAESSQPP